jgi:cyclophilin family peptidyl-prolyl cis-trans isomerase
MRLSTLALLLIMTPAAGIGQETFNVNNEPRVRFVTNLGEFVVELDRLRAPLTVENFLAYVSEGHYPGTVFHRVVTGFIAQGGGYTEELQLKPTERTVVNESGNGLSNLRGTIAMARSNDPHTADSQFYVNLADNLDLNPRPTRWGYTVFGTVVEGMEVVDQIGHTATGAGGDFDRNVPVDPIVIENVVILSAE